MKNREIIVLLFFLIFSLLFSESFIEKLPIKTYQIQFFIEFYCCKKIFIYSKLKLIIFDPGHQYILIKCTKSFFISIHLIILGKDEKSFAMYIDRQRSWFQHNSLHERRVEGGISTGSTIGVLLDLERHTLSFLVNGMPQGSVAFRDLYGVFYPAVSINRGVALTLHTALDAPQMDYF